MNFTATNRVQNREKRGYPLKLAALGLLVLTVWLTLGLFTMVGAQATTTLTLDLKGVTPTGSGTWLSLPLTGRFDVAAQGETIGRITANPSADQLAQGETDTLTIADSAVSEVTLTPVAEDFSDGFVCAGEIPVSVTPGQANQQTVFAYAKRGFFSIANRTSAGDALGTAEFTVLDAQGTLVLSFNTDASGAYTAQQALPNGDYQLVQMRAPEGTLLLTQPVPFTVSTYFGDTQSIAQVLVENEPAPLYNSTTGALALTTDGFLTQGGQTAASVEISGLCSAENDVPLKDYTVTLNPAKLLDRNGQALAAGQAVTVAQITVNRPDTAGCVVQALNAEGKPVGDPQTCQPGTAAALTDAAGVSISYLNDQGETTVPAGFTAGTVNVLLAYQPIATLPSEPSAATATMDAAVLYTYQYAGADGISEVTAASDITPQTLSLSIPDGKVTITANATVTTLESGAQAIVLAPVAAPFAENTLTVAVALPAGARAQEATLPDGLTLLRTQAQDEIVFDTALWAAGNITIPVAAGQVDALTLWVRDPQSRAVTVDEPEGFAIKADIHEAQPLLDALTQQADGQYAQLTVALQGSIDTGAAGADLPALLSGTVTEQAQQTATDSAALGVLLWGTDSRLTYGALTGAGGTFTVYGDQALTTGNVRVTLPTNTVSVATGNGAFETLENVNLPQTDLSVVYARMSALRGTALTPGGQSVAGIEVSVLQNGAELKNTRTDANGAWVLKSLAAGSYVLQFTLPQGVTATLAAQENMDRQQDGSYQIGDVSLAYGEERDIPISVTLLATLKGVVTGVDAEGQGLSVTLADESGKAANTQTDANGAYAFTALPAGTYRLTISLPENRTIVPGDTGGGNSEGVFTLSCTLGEGETREDQLQLEATGSIAGQIEALGEGQSLTAASLATQISVTTAKDGSFVFDGLASGDYSVYAPLPAGKTLLSDSPWQVTERGDMIWITVSVTAGNVCTLPAAEYVAMTSIQGVAYLVDNGDSVYSEGEQLMSGVPVALQKSDGDTWADVTNTKTDAYGAYAFNGLTVGDYRVVSQAEDGLSINAIGKSAVTLGDAALGVKAGDTIHLANGDTASGQSDIALSQPSGLRVAAFYDSNASGTRGMYERVITGITVEVVPANATDGAAVASLTTDANGEAVFEYLPAGEYAVRVTLPQGYLFTVSTDTWGLDSSCVGGSDEQTAVSAPLTLTAGKTVEAGVAAIPVGSFSGKVWNDLNNNGILDADEPGVANVKLTLTGSKTGGTYEFVTDDSGEYSFAQLRDDVYYFAAEIPDGTLFARYTQTGGDKRSVFTTEGTSAKREFIVTDAENVASKNVGIIEKSTIQGIAFLDANYNGVYDEGEQPYAGVTLEVIKNSNEKSMGKTVTGDEGRYSFASLRGGDYRLRAILPDDGSIFTVVPAVTDGLVNRFAAREGRRENSIASIQLATGETLETCVGVAMGGTITGTVSLDAKYDGVRDGSDKKLANIKVQLMDEAGTVAATAQTNGNGRYTLEGIMPGTYTVRILRKDKHAFTRYRPDEENGNHVKTLAKDGYGETEPIAVAMGQNIEGIDAGMLQSSTLTGIFFDDLNDNGIQDADEAGFVSGSVRLASADGELTLTEAVAADGTYFFDGVMPGEYTLTYLLPEHATMANVAEGGNTLEAQGQENVVGGYEVESGKAYTAPLVGAVTLGSFEGFAYHDANGNGVQDDGEEAMADVNITVTPKTAGVKPVNAVTDGDGRFAIAALRPGEYTLALVLPEGYIFSSDLKDSGIRLDAAAQVTVACPWAVLTNRVDNAIGAVKPATVRASVWLDENRDGQQTAEERLLGGLTYELYDEITKTVVQTARSAEDGYVTFTDVRPATYTVRFAIPDQAQPATETGGDFTASGGRMSQSGIPVAEGETVDGISGGLVSYTSIGGVVALDENSVRTPQAGVTVALYQGDAAQPEQTTTTDETGAYRFDGLWPDDYHIAVQLPSGMIFVKPDDPNYAQGDSVIATTEEGTGISDTITLQMAQHQLSANVLLIKPARVGDQVWLDTNKNGLIDTDEPSLNGVTVQLLQNGEVAYTTVSNDWGYYEFADVYPGTYTLAAQAYPELGITQSIPALKLISSSLVAGDGTNATSDPFSVVSGTRNFDYNLGFVLLDGQTMPDAVVPAPVQQWPATAAETN